MNPDHIVNQMLEAEDDLDMDYVLDRAKTDIEKRPKMLWSQPGGVQPVVATYFDCWNDDGSDEEEVWDWADTRSEAFFGSLMDTWKDVQGVDASALEQLKRRYRAVDGNTLFEEVAAVFVRAGYSVYHSDLFFEVYDPNDLTAEENRTSEEAN